VVQEYQQPLKKMSGFAVLVAVTGNQHDRIQPAAGKASSRRLSAAAEAMSGLQSCRIILLMGAPGSGKGTQGSILQSKFGLRSISTGAMLREEARRDTAAGRRLKKTMSSGGLVSDAMVCKAVESQVLAFAASRPAVNTLILDGFPRTVKQARYLDRLLDSLGYARPVAIHLDVPNDVLLERLALRRQCAACGAIYGPAASGVCPADGQPLVGREDDEAGIVARRLAAYEAETLPVIDFYRTCGRFDAYRRIDGNRSAAEIANDLCETLVFAETAVAA
jgi:adenylate kinase